MTEHRLECVTDGVRADKFVAESGIGISRSSAVSLFEKGLVSVNGKAVNKKQKLSAGDIVTVNVPEPVAYEAKAEDIPLDIVYEDSDLLVVNKPKGMVVHPAAGNFDGTLVNALLYHCGDSLSGINGVMRPGIVHRIDKDTSGLLIVAKNDFSHQALSAQLADRSLSRVYEAVVRGRLRENAGSIDRPIGRHPTDRKRMAVNEKNGRPAVTHWTVLDRYHGYTHIRCRLETGRTHQIRVHMASIGHPLLGDGVYGAPCPEKGLEGQCLHARELKFIHPRSGAPVHLVTDLPDWFTGVLARLGPKE